MTAGDEPDGGQPLLTVEHLTMRFGGLVAIDDVSFRPPTAQITAIIGPNGAGKTTVFNCLTGFYKPTVGRLTLHQPHGDDSCSSGWKASASRKRRGWRAPSRTFGCSRSMTRAGEPDRRAAQQADARLRLSPCCGLLGATGYRQAEARGGRPARATGSTARACSPRRTLMPATCRTATSGGSRSPAPCAPSRCCLCLDEPAAGLNPRESHELNRLLIFIRDEHEIGLLLIEHDMSVVMEISDHIVVLDYGRKIADGTPDVVRHTTRRSSAPISAKRETRKRRKCDKGTGSMSGGPAGEPLLAVSGVHTFYGNIEALRGVDVEVRQGEIVTLIGANGAGKSTLLMTICGNPRAAPGQRPVRRCTISRACRPTRSSGAGIAQSPEGRRIFPAHDGVGKPADGRDHRRPGPFRRRPGARLRDLPDPAPERSDQRGGTLSGGEQQMLAIARALMSRPRLLLLDEPSLGLAPLIVRQIFGIIREINAQQAMTVFLVEQNAYHALNLAHRGYVMVNGQITLQGTGQELLANEDVRAAYLEGGA